MRKPNRFILSAFSCLIIGLWLCDPSKSLGQSPQESPDSQSQSDSSANCDKITKSLGLTDNLTEVSDVRDATNAESVRLEQKIKELGSQISQAYTQEELDNRRKERDKT